jgi:superfamily II DNA or RNA helicase
MYLSKYGFVIKKCELDHNQLTKLKCDLIAKPIVDEKYTPDPTIYHFPIYIETLTKIYIPRSYGISKFHGGQISKLQNYKGVSTQLEFSGSLRDDQLEPYNCILSACKEKGGGILSLMTGGGKSIIALKTIVDLGKRALIIVNKISLKAQWEREIATFIPNAKVGIIQGRKLKDGIENCDILIGMLQSLSQIDYPKELFENIGTSVYDEVHNVSSRTYSKVLFKTTSQYMIGLSATPHRADGLSYLFKWHIGDIVYKSTSDRKGLSPIVNVYKLNSKEYTSSTLKNGRLNYSEMLNNLTKMENRNEYILDTIRNLASDTRRKILVLSDRREHLKSLHMKLKSDDNPDLCGLFLGSMKIDQLEKSKSSQVIFATYKAFGEGVSERDLNTLVLITPKKCNDSGNLDQIVGRIFRKEHTDINPMIIDLVDNFSIFVAQANGRMSFYKTKLSSETEINLDYINIDT